MKKKRLAVLLSLICMLTSILPTQVILANEVSLGHNIEENVDYRSDRTTPSAIDVGELAALIEKAEKISNEAVVGTTTGAYDILDKEKFERSIAEAKEELEGASSQESIEVAIEKLTLAMAVFKESQIIDKEALDMAALEGLLQEAINLRDATTTGSALGFCSESSKLNLSNAIIEAENAIQNAKTQNDINQAVKQLEMAIQLFKDSIIKAEVGDIDGSGAINVVDLALVAYYYQARESDENWDKARNADINQDGIVNSLDLSIVANKILN